ncbi:MAG: hypothetical protein PHG06_07215 [Parabacteroides sp.]|nr:hypothetical protein [Parabacteroides sp.]
MKVLNPDLVLVRGINSEWFRDNFSEMWIGFGGTPQANPKEKANYVGLYLGAPISAITHIGIVGDIRDYDGGADYNLLSIIKLNDPIPVDHAIRKHENWSLSDFGLNRSQMEDLRNRLLALKKKESLLYSNNDNKLTTIKNAIQQNNPNTISMIKEYLKTFLDSLPGYKLDYSKLSNANFIDEVEKSIQQMLPLKEEFLTFSQEIVNTQYCNSELFINFFEQMLQMYEDNEIEIYPDERLDYLANDNYRYFNQDLFLSFSVILFNNGRFDVLKDIVQGNFIVTRKKLRGEAEAKRFTSFQQFNYTLDKYKKERQNLNRISVIADLIKENCNTIIFNDIIKMDILLYYLSLIYPVNSMFYKQPWFPHISCYNDQLEILPKLISKRYFDKIKFLFDVDTTDGFKNKISSIEEPNIRNDYACHRLPNIQSGLCIEKVCTVE